MTSTRAPRRERMREQRRDDARERLGQKRGAVADAGGDGNDLALVRKVLFAPATAQSARRADHHARRQRAVGEALAARRVPGGAVGASGVDGARRAREKGIHNDASAGCHTGDGPSRLHDHADVLVTDDERKRREGRGGRRDLQRDEVQIAAAETAEERSHPHPAVAGQRRFGNVAQLRAAQRAGERPARTRPEGAREEVARDRAVEDDRLHGRRSSAGGAQTCSAPGIDTTASESRDAYTSPSIS